MAEEAAVTLKAYDEMSGPAAKAAASLQGLQSQMQGMATQGINVAKGAKIGTDGIGLMEVMASKRFEHVGMNLMLGQMASMQGTTPAVTRSLGLVSYALTGLAGISGPVALAIMAVAAAATFAASQHAKHAEAIKKVNEQYDKSLSALKGLTLNQIESSHQSIVQANATLQNLKAQLLIEQSTNTWRESIIRWAVTALESMAMVGRAIIALGSAMLHPIDAFKTLTDLWVAGKTKLTSALDAPTEAAKKLKEEISKLEPELLKANKAFDSLKAHGAEQFQVLHNVALETAKSIGTAMGETASGMQDAWHSAIKAMVGAFFDAAMGIVTASIAVSKAVTSMLIPGIGVVAGFAALAALAGFKAVAMAALTPKASTPTIATTAAVAGTSASTPTTGGTAVSSAQKEIVNNVTVNMPIQALDLAAISDTQLKALSFRVGKMLREASATGQFSLT